MTVKRLCRDLGRTGIVGLLVAMASARAQPVVNPEDLQLDATIQALKQQVIAIDGAGRVLERDAHYPAATRTAVAVSVSAPKLLIYDLSVAVDGAAASHYKFRDDEARALLKGGLHQVVLANLASGQHHLHAEFKANYGDARMDSKPVSGSVDGDFEKAAAPLTLELALTASGDSPAMKMRVWSSDAPASASAAERESLHLFGSPQ